MRFPLSDWIDDHSGLRHDLGVSGMRGSVRHPVPSAAEVRAADPEELRREFADSLDVDPRRVFLTHGASEGNTGVLWFLAHRYRNQRPRCRIRYPEYPPLFDGARWAGFDLADSDEPAALAISSQPRNPEGDLWGPDRVTEWANGARSLLIDETFREFAHRPSLVRVERPGLWVTGTLTKFFAGDDLRVGFVAAPEEERASYGRFHGVMFDEIAPASLAGALVTFRARERIRREVARLMERNRAAYRKGLPKSQPPQGPVFFDREVVPDGDSFANRCLAASVLVCPGSFFGDPSGVRVGLTRRSFPEDLAAYLRVREEARALPTGRVRARPASRGARPDRAGIGRGRAERA
jgi:histidinol-phosphate/aromatic aminotransferase/cobyric acid decarboxylase-like protein